MLYSISRSCISGRAQEFQSVFMNPSEPPAIAVE